MEVEYIPQMHECMRDKGREVGWPG